MWWGNKMVKFKDFNEDNLIDYTLDNLRSFVGEIESMVSVIKQKMSDEIFEVVNVDGFDIYSARGMRKVKKISKKYAESLAGAESYLEIINREIERREKYETNKSYEDISKEEFIQKEQTKIWADRAKIE